MGSVISSSSNTREARLDNLKMTYLNMDREVNALFKLKEKATQKMNETSDITRKALLLKDVEEYNARITRLGQVSSQFKKIHGLLTEIHLQGEYAVVTDKLLASVHRDSEKHEKMRENVIGAIRTNGTPGVKAITEKVQTAREELQKILSENDTDAERSTFTEIIQMMTEMGLPSVNEEITSEKVSAVTDPLTVPPSQRIDS